MPTILQYAFEKAGYRTTEQWLMDLAHEAWAKWSQPDGAGARRDFIESHLCHDATWIMLERYIPNGPKWLNESIYWWLNRAKEEIEAQQPLKRSEVWGQSASGGQRSSAPTHDYSGQRSIVDDHAGYARGGAEAARKVSPPSLGLVEAKRANLERLWELDRILINGRNMRRVTVGEARSWARKRGVECIFVRLVTANMQPEWVIGDYASDELAHELYQRAEVEYAAAT